MASMRMVACLVVGIAVTGHAAAAQLSPADANCRRGVARAVSRLFAGSFAAQRRCHRSRMFGRTEPTVDCNDSSRWFAASTFNADERFSARVLRSCAVAHPPAALDFTSCPEPCASPTLPTYLDVAHCLTCLVQNELRETALGVYGGFPAPPLALEASGVACQSRIGHALQAEITARMAVQRPCAFREDLDPTQTLDCRDLITVSLQHRFAQTDRQLGACTPEMLAALSSCAQNVVDEQACVHAGAQRSAERLFAAVYAPARSPIPIPSATPPPTVATGTFTPSLTPTHSPTPNPTNTCAPLLCLPGYYSHCSSGCGQCTCATPTPFAVTCTGACPDLTMWLIFYYGQAHACNVPPDPNVSRVCVGNSGDADAGAFHVRLPGGSEFVVNSLAAQSTDCRDMSFGFYDKATVDPYNEVAESNETNNTVQPMPPAALSYTPTCTMGVSDTPTPTPAPPTRTPSPTRTSCGASEPTILNVTSPTTELQQTINGQTDHSTNRYVRITSEAGSWQQSLGTSGSFAVTIDLLPNQINHLTVCIGNSVCPSPLACAPTFEIQQISP